MVAEEKDIRVKVGDREYEGFEVTNDEANARTTVLMLDEEHLKVHHIHYCAIGPAEIGTMVGDENALHRLIMMLTVSRTQGPNKPCGEDEGFMIQVDPDEAVKMLMQIFRALSREMDKDEIIKSIEDISELFLKYWDMDRINSFMSNPEDGDGD